MSLFYYLLSFLSGLALTWQVGINGQLREKIGNPVLASLISFTTGALTLAVALGVLLLSGGTTLKSNLFGDVRWWMLTGGFFGAFYLFTTIYATPKIGFANMFSLVICGQVLLSVALDHFGLFGNEVRSLNPMRLLGMLLLVSGVYIVQRF